MQQHWHLNKYFLDFCSLINLIFQALVVIFGSAVALAEAEAYRGGYGGYGGYSRGYGGYGGYGGYRGKREADAVAAPEADAAAVAAPEADAEAYRQVYAQPTLLKLLSYYSIHETILYLE